MKKLLLTSAFVLLSVPAMAAGVTKGDVQRLNLDSITLDSTTVTATGAEINNAADLSVKSEVVAATNTLTQAECGKTMTLAHATEFNTVLPSPLLGCEFTFIVGLAPSGASYTVKTGASAGAAEIIVGSAIDSHGGGVGRNTAGADTITFVDGTAAIGDMAKLWSDGTSYHTIAFSSSFGAITFSSAL